VVTPDVAKAVAFYSDLLGMSGEEQDMGEAGTYTVLSNAAGRQVGGAMNPPMEGVPPHWNVYFHVGDVDTTVTRAVELGGSSIAPAFDVPGIGRMAMLADEQGASFWVMQPSETTQT
jgi:predicted enzyme related to lactoylglutathione lyase